MKKWILVVLILGVNIYSLDVREWCENNYTPAIISPYTSDYSNCIEDIIDLGTNHHIFFRKGVYNLSKPIILTIGLHISGESMGNSGNKSELNFTSSNPSDVGIKYIYQDPDLTKAQLLNVKIENIRITTENPENTKNDANGISSGIHLHRAYSVTINNVTVEGFRTGIHFWESYNSGIYNSRIINNYQGLNLLNQTSHVLIQRTSISNNYLGVRIKGSENIVFQSCDLQWQKGYNENYNPGSYIYITENALFDLNLNQLRC